MKATDQYLGELERLFQKANHIGEEDTTGELLDAIPTLIQIVRVLTTTPPGKRDQVERWRFDTNRMRADQIINEAEKGQRDE